MRWEEDVPGLDLFDCNPLLGWQFTESSKESHRVPESSKLLVAGLDLACMLFRRSQA